nr:MAG TPA: hypothetical protein [Microviridae sp.]
MSCTRPLVRIPTSDGDFRVVSLKGYLSHSAAKLYVMYETARQNTDKRR